MTEYHQPVIEKPSCMVCHRGFNKRSEVMLLGPKKIIHRRCIKKGLRQFYRPN